MKNILEHIEQDENKLLQVSLIWFITEYLGAKKNVDVLLWQILNNRNERATSIEECKKFVVELKTSNVHFPGKIFNTKYKKYIAGILSPKALEIFSLYLCQRLMFDRSTFGEEKPELVAAENLIEDIRNHKYGVKETIFNWCLLCSAASAMDDLFENEYPEDVVKQIIDYIKEAFEVKNVLINKKENSYFFESEMYRKHLNNVGYTLLQIERSDSNKEKGKYLNLIQDIYDELTPFLKKTSNRKWQALVISNLGAVARARGDYALAVRYDLKALALKTSLISSEENSKNGVSRDLKLTTLKSHLNIVNNAAKAVKQVDMLYGHRDDLIAEYCRLIEIHSTEAVLLRKQLDNDVLYDGALEGFPRKEYCKEIFEKAGSELDSENFKYTRNILETMKIELMK